MRQNAPLTDNRTMGKLLITAIMATLLCVQASAQNAGEIRKGNSYIYAEATAAGTTEADSAAIDALAGKLAQTVELPYSSEVKKELMLTYLEDIKRECGMISSSSRRKATVMRYIQRSGMERIFDGRRRKVKEMLQIASTADRKCQMDVALRYYSWAETLMRSLPSPDVVAIAEAKSRREAILKGLNVEFDRQNIYDKGIVELTFTFDGKPVVNIDYRFFDGKAWSKVLSAKDWKGFVEVRPDSWIDEYRIKYEITPAHLRHLSREVSLVEKALASGTKDADGGAVSGNTGTGGRTGGAAAASEPSARKIDFSAVKKKVLDVVAREEFQREPDSTRGGIAPVVFSSEYEDIVSKVCKGISGEADESISEYFTPEGYETFSRLVRYGNARVLNFDNLTFYALGDEVYARSVPMVFSFSGNRRQFVENIVFTFNGDRQICDLSFSLGKETVQSIVGQRAWTEEARIILISFLESYKTAYALKRLDYISSIFDDDALIITGRVLRNVKGPNEYSGNRYVTLTRQSKSNYIRNLRRVFASQEYINLQFSDCEVMKLGKGEQLFGIKIRQEYFSTTYSDTGYLFILADLRDYRQPVIHVRTWQEEPDKEFGVIGPYNF